MAFPDKKKKPATDKKAAPHLALGKRGEDLAAAFLQNRKMKILERNWRPDGALETGLRELELDIIARERDTLVFVEVKTRALEDGSAFHPLDGFSPAKRGRLRKAAFLYLEETRAGERPCRFDLLCVTFAPADAAFGQPAGAARVEHFQDVIGAEPDFW